MHTLSALAELAEAEYRVSKINARIDAERQLIEALAFEGQDISSGQLVLDSLLISLFLCVEERERLRVTLHSIGDGVIATDAAGIITFMNPVAELLTG